VDFNYWLDCPAKASHQEDQVRLDVLGQFQAENL
jgi:hypothetical protein